MIDFAAARRMMVDGQIRTNDVTDLRLIGAMLAVPRERFVPAQKQAIAYIDREIPVDDSTRFLLKPMVLAKLIQAAAVDAGDCVLDVGCATGYSSAVLAQLAARVVALEEDAALAKIAVQSLHDVETGNVTIVSGPLVGGWPAEAPYDAILLNGATEIVPHALLRQLKDRGRLVGVLGGNPIGKATMYRSDGGYVTSQPIFEAASPLLPGFSQPTEFVF
jgi:protein-L-isoaspartate(D-aspartate) O-methyltransferase